MTRALAAAAIAALTGCPERAPEPETADAGDGSGDAGLDAPAALSWSPPEMQSELMPFGFNGNYDDPSLSLDLLELYFGATPRGEDEDIWRAARGEPGAGWSVVTRVDELSTDEHETGVSVSFDGLTVVFGRVVAGNGFDLYIATRADRRDRWGTPVPLTELNTSRSEAPGQLSLDGLTLYFASDRFGDFDIFAATRPSVDQPFAEAVLVPVASQADRDELSPSISADDNELTFAAADQPPFLELYIGRRDDLDEPFTRARPIEELNSDLSESDLRLGPSGRFAVMASDRTVLGRNRIWATSR